MSRAAFIYSEDLNAYNFGSRHPLQPIRLKMTYELADSYGLFGSAKSQLFSPRPATENELLLAHSREYLSAVRRLSENPDCDIDLSQVYFSSDNPPFAGMYEASALYVGASVIAAELIMSENVDVSFSISGGLHHAHHSRASGFCIFNDAVVAIHRLLEKFSRITYIDIDAHHGDGVQEAFYDTDKVLTVSMHESGRSLFPGTGSVEEIGEGNGLGFSVNAPLSPGSGDTAALRLFDEAILPIVTAYQPDVIVAQLGTDGHFSDPLTHLSYSTEGWLNLVQRILSLGVPVVALGGGGYDVQTVCRLWTLTYAAMLGATVSDTVPKSFSSVYRVFRLGDDTIPHISESEERKSNQEASRTIDEIKRLLFPLHHVDINKF